MRGRSVASAFSIGAGLIPALVLLLAAACTGASDTAPPSTTPPTAPRVNSTPTASPTASAEPPYLLPTPTELQQALVVNVVDGDTIDVLINGEEFRVRYIGIDTPETVDPRRPVECFGREARERNRQFVAGKTVGLERDVSETDTFDRLLRYVWLEGELVNATLVAEGYATASAFPPDVKYAELLASPPGGSDA